MTQRYVTWLPILALLGACASESGVSSDSGLSTDTFPPEIDGAETTDARPPDGGPPSTTARWARRTCSVEVRYAPRAGASSAMLAGDFTGWGTAPLPMSDLDGDGLYSITVGSEHGLVPGRVHAYKVIVDGEYVLDPNAVYRKYDGECVNSGLLAPACTSGPEIVPGLLSTTFDPRARTGTMNVRIAIEVAVDGAAPEAISFMLDGAPVSAANALLDEANGAYQLSIPGIAEGWHRLAIRVRDRMARDADAVDLPFWIEEHPFEWRDATMYMIMVDRFANGDRVVDAPVAGPVEYPADFHGGDLDGITQVVRSGYFESLGVNVLWLSPINDQSDGHYPGREDAREYSAYHGYWPERGRSVEPRFGGDDSLHVLIEEAHRRGIRVLLDLINNQIHQDHEYFSVHPDWFRTGCVCGLDPGCGWSERPLDCLFAPYLPDIDWRVPGAETQFVADAIHWIDAYGVDGFRIDAVKHVETNSIFDLRAVTARRFERAGYRHYFVGETAVGEADSVDYGCGERYGNGYQWLDAYTGPNALDGQFDFPTHHRLGGLVDGSLGFDGVEAAIRDAERALRPEGLHVRFLGTHDSPRIASRAVRDPAVGCTWQGSGSCMTMPRAVTDDTIYAQLRRAIAVLFTMPGIPFLYYGDELAMPGGGDPDNRRDMPWDGALAEVSMSSETPTAQQLAHRDFVRALGRARAESLALRRGRRIPLIVEPDVYAIAWAGDVPGELAIMVANRGAALSGRAIDGLGAGQLAGVTSFSLAAGSGTLRLRSDDSHRLLIDLAAGEVGLFFAH